MFVAHLHTHSCFSFMKGTAHPVELVKAAQKAGFSALSLTDTNGLYGGYIFYSACREAGIKPILGAEVVTDWGSITLIAENITGYANLSSLLTEAHLAVEYGENPIVSAKMLKKYSSNIFFLTGKSLFQLVEKGDIKNAENWALYLKSISKKVFIELFMHSKKDFDTCRKLTALADRLKISCVCTNDVCFIQKEDHLLQNVLSSAGHLTNVDRKTDDTASSAQYLKAPWEMSELFEDFPRALANVKYIVDKINLVLPEGNLLCPKVENGISESQEFTQLWNAAYQGLLKRYNPLTQEAIDRLNYEISVIESMGYTGYFLVVYDIVQYAKSQGIPVVGRGSAGDSLVSYCLGITNVDPLLHHLYFERFLHPERKSPPDIDLDICWKNRDRVIEYVFNKYGKDQCAMICSFVTFQSRSAFRDIAKSYGLSQSEVNVLTKKLPSYGGLEKLDEKMQQVTEYADFPADSEEIRHFIDLGKNLTHLPRHVSVHPCGIVVSPDCLHRRVPLERAAKGVIVTQYDMHSIEQAGLLKIDLLGVRGLSVFYDTFRLLKKRGVFLEMGSIPLNDRKTYELVGNGQTIGCFQIESPAMRGLLRNLKPREPEGIIQAVAHIRPGPSSGGLKDAFIRRFNGLETVEYIHPVLEPILAETFGVVVYQEQVLKIANTVAGLSMAESESIRRSMTKFKGRKGMEKNQDRFISGAIQNGFEESTALEIWEQIAGFAQYGFNKAHSATYGYLGYKSAYLKAHYPREFMASVLMNHGGFYSPMVYAEEARRLKIRILYPDVNISGEDISLYEGAVLMGLVNVKHVSQRTVQTALSERNISPFRSLYDFVRRVRPDVRELDNLIKAGAFGFTGLKKTELVLMGRMALKGIDYGKYRCDKDYTLSENIRNELEILGIAVSAHPVRMLSGLPPHVPIHRIGCYEGRDINVLGVVAASRKVITKNGQYMKFISLLDETGILECVLFPDVYRRFGMETRGGGILKFRGRVENDFDKITFTVKTVERLYAYETSQAV